MNESITLILGVFCLSPTVPNPFRLLWNLS